MPYISYVYGHGFSNPEEKPIAYRTLNKKGHKLFFTATFLFVCFIFSIRFYIAKRFY